jgi:hypothetical protein
VKASQPVTRECAACGAKFKAARKDKRYCSGRCRQRALRARDNQQDDLLREIEETKRRYWELVDCYREATGRMPIQTQFVDEHGNVFIGNRLVGRSRLHEVGWAFWGNEAAGPGFSPPTEYMHETFVTSRDD